jgi:trehalose 6-phosphate synthase
VAECGRGGRIYFASRTKAVAFVPFCTNSPVLSSSGIGTYRRVIQRFAEAACEEVDYDDPIIGCKIITLRSLQNVSRYGCPRTGLLVALSLATAERFGICPYRDQLLDGCSGRVSWGSTPANTATTSWIRWTVFLESRLIVSASQSRCKSQRTLIRPYPISIRWWTVSWIGELTGVGECRRRVSKELRLETSRVLGVRCRPVRHIRRD